MQRRATSSQRWHPLRTPNVAPTLARDHRQHSLPLNSAAQWTQSVLASSLDRRQGDPGGALRVKISRGAPLEVQNGTQQDLNKMIHLVNLGGKKIVYMLKMGGFEMGPNKI